MVVLGISGRHHDAAAALTVDGRLVAAASEGALLRVDRIGYGHTGGFPFNAAAACLERAGVAIDDVRVISISAEHARDAQGLRRAPGAFRRAAPPAGAHAALASRIHSLSPILVSQPLADAAHAAVAGDRDSAIVVVVDGSARASGVFLKRDGSLRRLAPISGLDELRRAASALAATLGCDSSSPYESLERAGAAGEPELAGEMRGAIAWTPAGGIAVDHDRLSHTVSARAGSVGREALANAESANVRVQEARRSLASSFHDALASVLCGIAEHFAAAERVDVVGIGGSLFANRGINTRLQRSFGNGLHVAPVPEACGQAVGAALAIGPPSLARSIPALTVGPDFSEAQMKAALENCRLDYVYEPNWTRLMGRVSTMLSRGKVVAWFQGAMDFGPRSLGSRSILCDPSNRYARDNINRYLKQRADDYPLAVSMTDEAADECLADPMRSPYMLLNGAVRAPWRDRLRAALDHRQSFPIHTVTASQAPALSELLETHRRRHGVPGLINTPLSGPGEPTACSPRDAIRTTFSSSIDALVMGRFLVMKDYWLLRSDSDE